jgi:hypothetical protein
MKVLISILIFTSILISSSNLLSQTGFWDRSQRVTSGFIDKNPAFDSKRTMSYNLSYISILVFERRTLLDNSNICALKFGYDSAFGGVKYITNDPNVINRNPKIAFKHISGYDSIVNAMVVWEKVENSRVNIYGCTYYNRVWSAPYPIDTGAGIKSSPHIAYNTVLSGSYLYSIVYERDGDIIFKNYESVLHQVWNDINLTDTVSAVCRNPKVSAMPNYAQPVFVAFERQKANGDFALYYKKSGTDYVFTGDTIALRGNNRNAEFINGFNGLSLSFESNFSGKWGIYEYVYSNTPQTNTLIQSPVFNYRNLKNFLYPIITNSPVYYSMLTSYIVQRPLATKIITSYLINPPMDSITVGDSSSKCVMTMNSGIARIGSSYVREWIVYDKDSAGLSSLEARGKLILIADVKKIGSEVPDKYSLGQNYPNPFNSLTVIRYQLSVAGNLSLKIYDVKGREVQTLVNESLQAGTYEVMFDGSAFNSGVYFYRMETEGFSETKKMVMIK